LKFLKVIAFTHKHIEIKDLGKFVICNETLHSSLERVKQRFDIPEIFYVGTCNRVEFVFTAEQTLDNEKILRLLITFFAFPAHWKAWW